MSDRAEHSDEKKHTNPATRQPAEEFIDPVNRPSIPESEAVDGDGGERQQKPPAKND